MARRKQIRIIKKIRESSGVWRFVSLRRNGARYVWDAREGVYFLEWWEGEKRRRETAGHTPSEALEARRRKQNELIGAQWAAGEPVPSVETVSRGASVAEARMMFLDHVSVHSPDKPKTHQRYSKVLEHFERLIGSNRLVETLTRTDIDEYKATRSRESSQQHPERRIAARTINFEVGVLRTFFYFLSNERGLQIENPCARFKPLRDSKERSRRRPPTYSQDQLDRLFEVCDPFEKAVFATFLLTGLREQELCFLTWADVDLRAGRAAVRVTGDGKDGFSPKDYEERLIPVPDELATIVRPLPHDARWVFPTERGGRQTHLLRRLKRIAERAGVADATLHRFRHTYATRLLESGCDVVTVQRLMGHSDIDTTRQYLDPDQDLKRRAVARLSIGGSAAGRST